MLSEWLCYLNGSSVQMFTSIDSAIVKEMKDPLNLSDESGFLPKGMDSPV